MFLNVRQTAVKVLLTTMITSCLASQPAWAARSTSNSLPETRALESDLATAQSSIASTRERQQRLQASARDVRKDLEDIKKLIHALKAGEDKIKRIENELNSLSKIPQLKMLKPIASGLKSMRYKVEKIRKKADNFRRNHVEPNIARLKRFEAQVAKTVVKLRGMETKVQQARQQVVEMRVFAEANISQRQITSGLESIARTGRDGMRPLNNGLSEIDSVGRSVESTLNSYKTATRKVLSLKSGVDELNSKLAPIDKKARDLAKVMNKQLGFKVPFTDKRVSFTVRKILEAPEKILKVAVKPLTKIAEKLLSPLTKKVKFDVEPPKKLAELEREIDRMLNMRPDFDALERRLRDATNSRSLQQVESALQRLITSQSALLASSKNLPQRGGNPKPKNDRFQQHQEEERPPAMFVIFD